LATKSKPDTPRETSPVSPVPFRSRRARVEDPSAGLFRRVRRGLTLWYTAVLGLALLLFGIGLYFGERQVLLDPVNRDIQRGAQALASASQGQFVPAGIAAPPPICDPRFLPADLSRSLLAVCYSPQGVPYVQGEGSRDISTIAQGFSDASFAETALHNGSAEDTVSTTSALGEVRRYALRVTDSQGDTMGVVQVGESIHGETRALGTLLQLLLIFGGAAIIVASFGGLFLANRALMPARRAHIRQRNFIADASHELRTPLTMLRANAEVLLRGRDRLSPEDVALLEDVVAEASNMSSLADTMLNLARLDAGETHLEHDVVDLADLARGLMRRAQPLATERDITVQVLDHAPVIVIGDRLLLEQAALVLVDNAIKYNLPGGRVEILAERSGDKARLQVHDTGIGIAAEHLPHLGERFYRVDKARSREFGGAGLGISIARSIAERHGGTLYLESAQDQGTTATLTLPAARPASGHSTTSS
jgi:signal transduction histidine kinase